MFLTLKRLTTVLILCSGGALAQDGSKNLTLLGIPAATTAPSGVVFGQISRSVNLYDNGFAGDNSENRTVLSLGAGFGDANDGIGAQVAFVGARDTDVYDSFTYFNAKLSRRISAGADPTYLGFSVGRIAGSGEASDLDTTVNLILTKFDTFSMGQDTYPVMFTVGAGSDVRNGEDPGVFFGAGMGVTSSLGVSGAWSGEQVDLGAALRFNGLKNARLAVVVTDALEHEDRRQLTIGLSWSIDIGRGR